MNYKKVGGLHFARLGRLSFSWSVKRKANPAPRAKHAKPSKPVLLGMDYLLSTSNA
jgi:hypothetical protein